MATVPVPNEDIRNNIETLLNTISIGNNFNTNIQKVFVGKVLSPEKFTDRERDALVQVRYEGQTNSKSNNFSGQIHNSAETTFLLAVSMKDKTEVQFMRFLADIEAVLEQCPDMSSIGVWYKVGNSITESVRVVSSNEKDELEDTNSLQIFEQYAELSLVVQYFYLPDGISGV